MLNKLKFMKNHSLQIKTTVSTKVAHLLKHFADALMIFRLTSHFLAKNTK